MTDISHTTMRIDWRARREAALEKTLADLKRFEQEFPDEDVDVPVEVIDAVVDGIVAAPLEKLADVRLYAKALLAGSMGCGYDSDNVERLLEALVAMPPRLWDEPIGETAN